MPQFSSNIDMLYTIGSHFERAFRISLFQRDTITDRDNHFREEIELSPKKPVFLQKSNVESENRLHK